MFGRKFKILSSFILVCVILLISLGSVSANTATDGNLVTNTIQKHTSGHILGSALSGNLKQYFITPVVNSGDRIVYGEITFKEGDVVTLTAGGGVQTGGHGRTWKRYVNPLGPNSDRLYFGKVYIPGITQDMTPIRDLVGRYGVFGVLHPDKCTLTFTIPNINGLPLDERYLGLQYMDDGYGDNGYYAHDDGTSDQCKGVGNAYVNITISSQN